MAHLNLMSLYIMTGFRTFKNPGTNIGYEKGAQWIRTTFGQMQE